jgi:hypothetical protein
MELENLRKALNDLELRKNDKRELAEFKAKI